MSGTLNRQWHKEHGLAERAGLDERIKWHIAHAKACGCRPIPTALQDEIERRTAFQEQGDKHEQS